MDEMHLYYDSIGQLEAQEILLLLKVQDWSNMKDQARSRMWNELNKEAFKQRNANINKMSNDDLDKWLRGFLGG